MGTLIFVLNATNRKNWTVGCKFQGSKTHGKSENKVSNSSSGRHMKCNDGGGADVIVMCNECLLFKNSFVGGFNWFWVGFMYFQIRPMRFFLIILVFNGLIFHNSIIYHCKRQCSGFFVFQ